MTDGQNDGDEEEGLANRRLVIMLIAGLAMIVVGMVVVFSLIH
ncbi:MAG TPA: hypothetical protein VL147_07600 [Devosia sp.]|jgi:hypothetical protein|nr:hypothetical protein [Devosia sp.]